MHSSYLPNSNSFICGASHREAVSIIFKVFGMNQPWVVRTLDLLNCKNSALKWNKNSDIDMGNWSSRKAWLLITNFATSFSISSFLFFKRDMKGEKNKQIHGQKSCLTAWYGKFINNASFDIIPE